MQHEAATDIANLTNEWDRIKPKNLGSPAVLILAGSFRLVGRVPLICRDMEDRNIDSSAMGYANQPQLQLCSLER